jgi:hypothetical protein
MPSGRAPSSTSFDSGTNAMRALHFASRVTASFDSGTDAAVRAVRLARHAILIAALRAVYFAMRAGWLSSVAIACFCLPVSRAMTRSVTFSAGVPQFSISVT